MKALIVIALVAMSSNALAGGSRASDLTPYFDAINESIKGNTDRKKPRWQTPKAAQPKRTPELTVRRINNHKRGNNFYKSFTFRSNDTGRRYELDIEPNLLSGYELNGLGDTTFKARDRRTGEDVILVVPSSSWRYSY